MIYETELVYMKDAYLTELETEIIGSGQDEEGHTLLYLDSTIFYPESGGQASDTGLIIGGSGSARLFHARYSQGIVLHRCEIEGSLQTGDAVKCRLDWLERYRNMRAHTAGHILHDALKKLLYAARLVPIKGNHKKLYVDYEGGTLPEGAAAELEGGCNEIISANLPTHWQMVNLEELKSLCSYVPPNLPSDKPLRILWLEGFEPFPCGGTHVRNTGEVGRMQILSAGVKRGVNHIRYLIEDPPQ